LTRNLNHAKLTIEHYYDVGEGYSNLPTKTRLHHHDADLYTTYIDGDGTKLFTSWGVDLNNPQQNQLTPQGSVLCYKNFLLLKINFNNLAQKTNYQNDILDGRQICQVCYLLNIKF